MGPGEFDRLLGAEDRLVVTADGEKTRVLNEPPPWISRFRACSRTRAMGSLLTQVDGRDVRLATGYHKIGVDIRDQIAAT